MDSDRDVTNTVKAFYEEHPFPNYDDFDSLRSLIAKSREGTYAALLGEQIPHNTTVLELGCGTGQLTNFLACGCRTVIGTDICLNSLRLAEEFRSRHGLSRARFIQMNLFRPALCKARFDFVLCNGVLHHTSDPYGGFKTIAELVRPGGHIVIGLYNRYGRVMTDARRTVFRLLNGRCRWIDPILRNKDPGAAKGEAWFADQYEHPHESKHTVEEVLEWFDANGFDFVNSFPKTRALENSKADERLFEPRERGTALDHRLMQAIMVLTGSREGGFFVMIGRKGAA